jgi:hypothetical protein
VLGTLLPFALFHNVIDVLVPEEGSEFVSDSVVSVPGVACASVLCRGGPCCFIIQSHASICLCATGSVRSWLVCVEPARRTRARRRAACSAHVTSKFLTLIPGSPPKVASPSTRHAAAVGSTVLPAYNAQGGPLGKGHVSFDRTQTQYLDGGARTFNIASNGGFTVVAVVRFRGSPGNGKGSLTLGMERLTIISCCSGRHQQ